MATLKENITQAIADFDSIKTAIEEQGIEIPYDTNTSEYADKIRQISGTAKCECIIDTELSETSVNAVQNAVITAELKKKQDAKELENATITNLEIEEIMR